MTRATLIFSNATLALGTSTAMAAKTHTGVHVSEVEPIIANLVRSPDPASLIKVAGQIAQISDMPLSELQENVFVSSSGNNDQAQLLRATYRPRSRNQSRDEQPVTTSG